MSHLDLSGVCVEQGGLSAGAMFTIANPLGQYDASPVTIRRSDGTVHGVTVLPAGDSLTEFVPGDQPSVKVIAVFPNPKAGEPLVVKIKRLELDCRVPATTTTTTPVPPTIVDTIPPTTWVEPTTTVPATATTISTRGTLPPAIPMTVPATHPGAAATAVTTTAMTLPAELAYTGGGDAIFVGLGLLACVAGAVLINAVRR
jgi:hypothetical protein